VASSTAGSTAARSPSGERARRRASRDGAVPPAPPGHHGQWPSPLRSVEREGGGENDARVLGRGDGDAGFDLAKTADDRPIVINGHEIVSPPGLVDGPCGRGEGTPRRADSAARPLAVGPRAQGKVAEQAAGRFCFWAA